MAPGHWIASEHTFSGMMSSYLYYQLPVKTDTPTEFWLVDTTADIQKRREEREARERGEEAQKQREERHTEEARREETHTQQRREWEKIVTKVTQK